MCCLNRVMRGIKLFFARGHVGVASRVIRTSLKIFSPCVRSIVLNI